MTELLLKDEVFAIVGAAMEVHNQLGTGFLEAVYHEAMEIEERLRGIPFESNKKLKIRYKGHLLNKEYEADQVCFDQVIVEMKAAAQNWSGRGLCAEAVRYVDLRVKVGRNGFRPTNLYNFRQATLK